MKPRTTAPSETNKYYIHISNGGYNKCIKISGKSCLPNCVGYAYGRFMEIAGKTTCKLPMCNAEDWWNNSAAYKKGKTPKLGAVMCFAKGKAGKESDGCGHVLIVEKIYKDGSILCSQSGYNYKRFYTTKFKKPYSLAGYKFQGFIYNPYVNEQKVHDVVNELAHPLGTKKSVYTTTATKKFTKALKEVYPDRSKWGDAPKVGKACDPAVGVVLRKSGVCPKFPRGLDQQIKYTHKNLKAHENENVTPYSVIKEIGTYKTLVVQYKNKDGSGHTLIWDRGYFEEASLEKKYLLKRKSIAKLKKKRAFVRILEIL